MRLPAFVALIVLSSLLQASLSLRIAGLRNGLLRAAPRDGLVGNDQLKNPVNNIGYGGRIHSLPGKTIPSADAEATEHTDFDVFRCPRIENEIAEGTSSRQMCPRGWRNGPSCDEPDLRNLGKCKWEDEAELDLSRSKKFKGMRCLGRRMRCMREAGIIPGNTELIFAPKNFIFDETELAQALSHLRMLAAIDLSRNFLYFLSPKTFTNSVALKSVKFDMNFLLDLPEKTFFRNRQLKSVSFAVNKLDYLPPRLFFLNPFLTVVNFAKNNISRIPPDMFRRNRRLEVVRLGGNVLSEVPAGLFAANPFLREVDLAHNRITRLPKSLFRNNRRLREISLAGNEIEHIPENLFDNCRELHTIHLERNKIKALPARLFERNKKLSLLDISYNSFHGVDPELFVDNPLFYILNRYRDRQRVVMSEKSEENDDSSWSSNRLPNPVRKSSPTGN